MFKSLLRTIPTLSGNVKINCYLTDFNKIDNENYNAFIRVADLSPLQNSLLNRNIKLSLISGSYEYDIAKYYHYYNNSFYSSNYTFNKTDYQLLDLVSGNMVNSRNKDYEFGCKRLPFSQTDYQFNFFAPIYCDDINDLPEYFNLTIQLGAITKNINIYIGKKNDKNYLRNYLTKYISKIGKEVIKLNCSTNTAVYYGVDIVNGGIVSNNDFIISKIFNSQLTLNEYDNIICEGFKRNNMVLRQIIPLSFSFNVKDILTPAEYKYFINKKIKISGIYKSSILSHNLNDFDVNYYNLHISKKTYNYKTDKYNNIVSDENILDQDYPGLHEKRYIKNKYTNKLSPVYNRWVLSSNNDYIINSNYMFENVFIDNISDKINIYGEYPLESDYNLPVGYLDEEQNIFLPYGNYFHKNESMYGFYVDAEGNQTSILKNYINHMNNYVSEWYKIYPLSIDENTNKYDLSDKIKLNTLFDKVNWEHVENNKIYYNGVLYDFNKLFNNINQNIKVDYFNIFVNPILDYKYEKNDMYMYVKNVLTYMGKDKENITFSNTVMVNTEHDDQNIFICPQETKYESVYDNNPSDKLNLNLSGNNMNIEYNCIMYKDNKYGNYIEYKDFYNKNKYYLLRDILPVLQSEDTKNKLSKIFSKHSDLENFISKFVNKLKLHYIEGRLLLPFGSNNNIIYTSNRYVQDYLGKPEEYVNTLNETEEEKKSHLNEFFSIIDKNIYDKPLYVDKNGDPTTIYKFVPLEKTKSLWYQDFILEDYNINGYIDYKNYIYNTNIETSNKTSTKKNIFDSLDTTISDIEVTNYNYKYYEKKKFISLSLVANLVKEILSKAYTEDEVEVFNKIYEIINDESNIPNFLYNPYYKVDDEVMVDFFEESSESKNRIYNNNYNVDDKYYNLFVDEFNIEDFIYKINNLLDEQKNRSINELKKLSDKYDLNINWEIFEDAIEQLKSIEDEEIQKIIYKIINVFNYYKKLNIEDLQKEKFYGKFLNNSHIFEYFNKMTINNPNKDLSDFGLYYKERYYNFSDYYLYPNIKSYEEYKNKYNIDINNVTKEGETNPFIDHKNTHGLDLVFYDKYTNILSYNVKTKKYEVKLYYNWINASKNLKIDSKTIGHISDITKSAFEKTYELNEFIVKLSKTKNEKNNFTFTDNITDNINKYNYTKKVDETGNYEKFIDPDDNVEKEVMVNISNETIEATKEINLELDLYFLSNFYVLPNYIYDVLMEENKYDETLFGIYIYKLDNNYKNYKNEIVFDINSHGKLQFLLNDKQVIKNAFTIDKLKYNKFLFSVTSESNYNNIYTSSVEPIINDIYVTEISSKYIISLFESGTIKPINNNKSYYHNKYYSPMFIDYKKSNEFKNLLYGDISNFKVDNSYKFIINYFIDNGKINVDELKSKRIINNVEEINGYFGEEICENIINYILSTSDNIKLFIDIILYPKNDSEYIIKESFVNNCGIELYSKNKLVDVNFINDFNNQDIKKVDTDYMNIYTDDNGLTFGFYLLDIKCSNLSDNFYINNNSDSKLFIKKINNKDIVTEFKPNFKYIYPFIKNVNLFSKLDKSTNVLLKQNNLKILLKYYPQIVDNGESVKSFLYNGIFYDITEKKKLEDKNLDVKKYDDVYDIYINKSTNKYCNLYRYFDSIMPRFITIDGDIHDRFELKYKEVKSQINENNILLKPLNINKYNGINVLNKSNIVNNVEEFEYKHFNDNKFYLLNEKIEIDIDGEYLYEDLLKLENKEYVIEIFKKYLLNILKLKTISDDEVLFLFNRYNLNLSSMPIRLNTSNKKLYTLKYKFTLK